MSRFPMQLVAYPSARSSVERQPAGFHALPAGARAIERREDRREPQQPEAREPAILQSRDHRLVDARCALERELCPATLASPASHQLANDVEPMLDLRTDERHAAVGSWVRHPAISTSGDRPPIGARFP